MKRITVLSRWIFPCLAFSIAVSMLFMAPFCEANQAELIVYNGKVFSHKNSFHEAFAVEDGKFVKVGSNVEILKLKGSKTKVIDAKGRTVIPGLIDTHAHPIREGLNYNLELRWDGVKSLKVALDMIREQARRTPKGQWIRVVGGWSPHQFKENRFPTLEEINQASPDHPVFVLYLYSMAFLNKAALDYVGYSSSTKYPRGEVRLDNQGNPTGLLIAKPSALILYKTLVKGPKLSDADKLNSTLHWIRELNRFGLTTVIDAGGGGFFYPEDHKIVNDLLARHALNIRLPFYLFAPNAGKEYDFFKKWINIIRPATDYQLKEGDKYHLMGAGENITWASADFENFMEPRPDLGPDMEKQLRPILSAVLKHGWIFRIHSTYDETITRILNVVEAIYAKNPEYRDRFVIDHAETISKANLKRIKALGGGISIQHRMAFQGEEFVKRYGSKMAEHAPPIADILKLGIPLGSGTDATRVATYNPWVALYWHVTGKTVGGLKHLADTNILDRKRALYLWTKGASWFSKEEHVKGDINAGELADFAILNDDYFSVAPEKIKDIESVLTAVGGKIVYGAGEYRNLAQQLPKVSPAWSPVAHFGGYGAPKRKNN